MKAHCWLLFACLFATGQAFMVSPRMGGFGGAGGAKSSKGGGGGKKAAAAAAPLSPKRQWERLREQRDAGSEIVPVFARVAKEEKWYEVGDVTAGKGIEVAAAVQVQKRMVLEHAVRVHPQLLPKAKQLECGFGEPSRLLPKVDPADPANAGFVGRADASGRYGECGGCKNAPPDKYPQLLTLTPFAPMPLSLTGKTQGEIDTLEPTSLRKATKSIADAGGSADRDSKGRM